MLWRFAARRLGQSLIVLLGVTLVVFTLIHLVPGDPVRVGLGTRFDPATYAALRHRAGLDQPLVTQYFRYLAHAVTGDLGVSFQDGQPVTQILLQRLPATLSLAVTGLLIGLVIAFPLGLLAAIRHDTENVASEIDEVEQSFSEVDEQMAKFKVSAGRFVQSFAA